MIEEEFFLAGPTRKEKMFTVRVVAGGEKALNLRDTKFNTKREALTFISSLGDLNFIKKLDKLYIVQPKKK
jgi:hypothetical protein